MLIKHLNNRPNILPCTINLESEAQTSPEKIPDGFCAGWTPDGISGGDCIALSMSSLS